MINVLWVSVEFLSSFWGGTIKTAGDVLEIESSAFPVWDAVCGSFNVWNIPLSNKKVVLCIYLVIMIPNSHKV